MFAKNNTVVIVSDKRVTEGTYSMSAHGDLVQKIHKVTEKCGLTIAGDAGTATVLIEKYLKLIKKRTKSLAVSEAAELFRSVAVEYYTKWYKDMTMKEWHDNVRNDIIPFFRILLAGYDEDEKGKLTKRKIIEISSLRRFAPVNCTVNFSSIGVTTIAQYLLYRFYTNDQEEDVVAGLGAFCIQETSSQDDSVGDEFQVASFSQNKAFQFYNDEELLKIKKRCAELKTELQTALFTKPKVKEN